MIILWFQKAPLFVLSGVKLLYISQLKRLTINCTKTIMVSKKNMLILLRMFFVDKETKFI